MSVSSWVEEFARGVSTSKVSRYVALKREWLFFCGLLPDSLEKHEVRLTKRWYLVPIYGGDERLYLNADGEKRWLCKKYYRYLGKPHPCGDCPIYHIRKASCDRPKKGEKASPWALAKNGKPERMMELINEALKAGGAK